MQKKYVNIPVPIKLIKKCNPQAGSNYSLQGNFRCVDGKILFDFHSYKISKQTSCGNITKESTISLEEATKAEHNSNRENSTLIDEELMKDVEGLIINLKKEIHKLNEERTQNDLETSKKMCELKEINAKLLEENLKLKQENSQRINNINEKKIKGVTLLKEHEINNKYNDLSFEDLRNCLEISESKNISLEESNRNMLESIEKMEEQLRIKDNLLIEANEINLDNQNLQEEINKSNLIIDENANKINYLKFTNIRLSNKITESLSENENLSNKINQIYLEKEKLTKEINKINLKNENLTNEINQKTKEFDDKLIELNKNNNKLNEEINENNSKINELTLENTHLKEKLNQLSTDKDINGINDLNNKNIKLINEVNCVKNTLENDISKLHLKNNKLNDQIKEINSENINLKKDLSQLNAALSELKSKKQNLINELNVVNNQYKALLDVVNKSSTKNKSTKNKTLDNQLLNENLLAKINELYSANEKLINEIKIKDDRHVQLMDELNIKNINYNDLSEKFEITNRRIKNLYSINENLLKEKKELTIERDKIIEENKNIKGIEKITQQVQKKSQKLKNNIKSITDKLSNENETVDLIHNNIYLSNEKLVEERDELKRINILLIENIKRQEKYLSMYQDILSKLSQLKEISCEIKKDFALIESKENQKSSIIERLKREKNELVHENKILIFNKEDIILKLNKAKNINEAIRKDKLDLQSQNAHIIFYWFKREILYFRKLENELTDKFYNIYSIFRKIDQTKVLVSQEIHSFNCQNNLLVDDLNRISNKFMHMKEKFLKIENIFNKIQSFDQQKYSFLAFIYQLKAQIEIYNEVIEEKDDKFIKLSKENKKLNNLIYNLTNQLQVPQQLFDDFVKNTQIEFNKKELNDLLSLNQRYEVENKALISLKEAFLEEIRAVNEEKRNLLLKYNHSFEKSTDLEEEIRKYKLEKEDILNKINKLLEDKKMLTNEVKRLSQGNNSLSQTNDNSIKVDTKDYNSKFNVNEFDKITSENGAVLDENRNLEEDILVLSNQNEYLIQQNNNVFHEKKCLEEELEFLRKRIYELEEEQRFYLEIDKNVNKEELKNNAVIDKELRDNQNIQCIKYELSKHKDTNENEEVNNVNEYKQELEFIKNKVKLIEENIKNTHKVTNEYEFDHKNKNELNYDKLINELKESLSLELNELNKERINTLTNELNEIKNKLNLNNNQPINENYFMELGNNIKHNKLTALKNDNVSTDNQLLNKNNSLSEGELIVYIESLIYGNLSEIFEEIKQIKNKISEDESNYNLIKQVFDSYNEEINSIKQQLSLGSFNEILKKIRLLLLKYPSKQQMLRIYDNLENRVIGMEGSLKNQKNEITKAKEIANKFKEKNKQLEKQHKFLIDKFNYTFDTFNKIFDKLNDIEQKYKNNIAIERLNDTQEREKNSQKNTLLIDSLKSDEVLKETTIIEDDLEINESENTNKESREKEFDDTRELLNEKDFNREIQENHLLVNISDKTLNNDSHRIIKENDLNITKESINDKITKENISNDILNKNTTEKLNIINDSNKIINENDLVVVKEENNNLSNELNKRIQKDNLEIILQNEFINILREVNEMESNALVTNKQKDTLQTEKINELNYLPEENKSMTDNCIKEVTEIKSKKFKVSECVYNEGDKGITKIKSMNKNLYYKIKGVVLNFFDFIKCNGSDYVCTIDLSDGDFLRLKHFTAKKDPLISFIPGDVVVINGVKNLNDYSVTKKTTKFLFLYNALFTKRDDLEVNYFKRHFFAREKYTLQLFQLKYTQNSFDFIGLILEVKDEPEGGLGLLITDFTYNPLIKDNKEILGYKNNMILYLKLHVKTYERMKQGLEEIIKKGDVYYFKSIKVELSNDLLKGIIFEEKKFSRIKREDVINYFYKMNEEYLLSNSVDVIANNAKYLKKTLFLRERLNYLKETTFGNEENSLFEEGFFKIKGRIKQVRFVVHDYCLKCRTLDDCHASSLQLESTRILFINNSIERWIYFIGRFNESYLERDFYLFISKSVFNNECVYQMYGWYCLDDE